MPTRVRVVNEMRSSCRSAMSMGKKTTALVRVRVRVRIRVRVRVRATHDTIHATRPGRYYAMRPWRCYAVRPGRCYAIL